MRTSLLLFLLILLLLSVRKCCVDLFILTGNKTCELRSVTILSSYNSDATRTTYSTTKNTSGRFVYCCMLLGNGSHCTKPGNLVVILSSAIPNILNTFTTPQFVYS